MMPRICIALLLIQIAPAQTPRQRKEPAEAVRFQAVDIFIDAGTQPLAAYQLEVLCDAAEAKIVGVEGGEAESYKIAPYDLNDDTMLYFTYATGFLSGAGNIAGNFTDEQESTSYEAGVKSVWLDEAESGSRNSGA